MNCKNYEPITPEPLKVGQEVWWDGIARHIGKQRDGCLVTIKWLPCTEENYYLINTGSQGYAVDTDTLSPICPARNRPFSEPEPLPLTPEPIKKGDMVITLGNRLAIIGVFPVERECNYNVIGETHTTHTTAIENVRSLAIDAQFTAEYKGEVGEFKIVDRRQVQCGELTLWPSGKIDKWACETIGKYWIVERVTPAETFADGELVVCKKCLYAIDGDVKKESGVDAVWHYCKNIPKEYRLRMDDDYLSKLIIGSQFVTKCKPEIYPSGQGEFLVVDMARLPLNGEFALDDNGRVFIANHNYHSLRRIIVIPCDLAYYTQTISPGVSVIAYEIEGGCRICKYSTKTVTDIETAWMWDKPDNWSLSDAILNDINPPVVPLSVSAKTGVIAPKVEV